MNRILYVRIHPRRSGRYFHVQKNGKTGFKYKNNMTKREYYKNVIGVNYDDLLKVGNGYIDGKKPDFKTQVPRTNPPSGQSLRNPSETKAGLGIQTDTLADEKFIQHIEYLHERSFWSIYFKFIWYTWFWPAAAIVLLTYNAYNEGEDIEIQGLQWENMQDLLKLKVEMKQYQNINLTMGNLPSFPLVNMHMANDLTNEMKQKEFEKRIFENINSILVLKEGFCTMSNKPLSYDLLILFSAFYLNEFRKSNIPNTFLLKNRILFLKRLLHHKSGFTFSIIIYNLIKKLFDLLLFEGSYLMRPEDRAVVSYEQNLFYRHLIHAFGAPGLAMTRMVKSDDDELEEIAEDFLLFHDEAPEDETFVKISFDVTPTLDSDRCFLKCAQQMSDTLETASQKITKMESFIPFMDDIHSMHGIGNGEKRIIPKKGNHQKVKEEKEKSKEEKYWKNLSYVIMASANRRHFMLNTRDKIFGSDIYDKKELWFGQKVLAAFLYQSLYGMHANMDCGCDFATPMSNGALIRMFLLKEILAYK